MATFVRDASPNLSLREKATLKRRINKEHNSNFRAGYVHVNEEYLHKTGIRGRKSYCIYFIMAFMALVAIVNIIITVMLIGKLVIDREGMKSLEFTPGGLMLWFLEESDMGEVYTHQNTLNSLPYSNLELEGFNGNSVFLRSGANDNDSTDASSVEVGPLGVKIISRDGFQVISPETGETVFTSDIDEMNYPVKSDTLESDKVLTNKVTSKVDEDLNVKSDKIATLKGNEGLSMQGKEVVLNADQALNLMTQQHITLNGQNTYMKFFDPGDEASMPVSRIPTGHESATKSEAYTVCVCLPSGKLFLVPSPDTCNDANEDKNPCDDE